MATVCYPAIPAVPGRDAQVNTDSNLGWNAGATSIRVASGDARAEFSISSANIGSLVGFAAPGTPVGAFNGITHGFQYVGDTIEVVQGGTFVTDTTIVPTNDMRLIIERVNGTVTYYIDDWSYTSLLKSTGDIQLYAALYAAGDYVDSPMFASITSMSAHSDWGWDDEISRTAMRAHSDWGWEGTLSLGDGEAIFSYDFSVLGSEEAFGFGTLDLGGVVTDAVVGFPEIDVTGFAAMFPTSLVAVGSSVFGTEVEVEIGYEMIGSEEEYGVGGGVVADFTVLGADPGEAPNAGSYTEAIYTADMYVSDPVIFAVLNSTLVVGSIMDVMIAIDADLTDFLIHGDDYNANQLIEAILTSGLVFSDDVRMVGAELLQYATNIKTGAVTRYSGYGFQGFTSVGLHGYGWKPDGLYRLGASTDDGELISALVDFAATDFGDARAKNLTTMFFGLNSDGDLFAKVTDDTDREVIYKLMTRNGDFRADFARGIRSRFWRVQLQVLQASYAELTDVTWVQGTITRQTSR